MKTVNEGKKGQSVPKNFFLCLFSSFFLSIVCSLFFFVRLFVFLILKGQGEGEQVNQHGMEDNEEHGGEGGKNLSGVG